MKKLVLTAALLGLTASAASAQSVQQDINISAEVPKFCTIAGSATPGALTATIPVSATGVVDTTAIPFTVANATCNTASDVVASSLSGGVKSATPAAVGFTNIINYTGVATLGAGSSTINTATVATAAALETGSTGDTGGAVTGNLTITITPASTASPLMAATDYADTMRVTMTPR